MTRFGFLLSLLLAPPLAAQTTIETISFWDGSTAVSEFGKTNTATYGQTFTVPTVDNVLQSFSFFLRDASAGDQLLFRGYVSRWDTGANLLTGPLLYTSSVRTGPGTSDFTRYDFLTGGIPLLSGEVYIAFLSSSGLFDDIPVGVAQTQWGYLDDDVYSGGGFWFRNNGDDFADLSTFTWENFAGGGVDDLAFELQFNQGGPTVVPEPATVMLVGTGLGLLLVAGRRRRKV